MKFSLLFQMQLSDPTPEAEQRLLRRCVEDAELAEELGYHGVWAVGHHGLAEYAHASAPDVFLAFVAARTKRLRLGLGSTPSDERGRHAVQLAERLATLDILSEGRVGYCASVTESPVESSREAAAVEDPWRTTMATLTHLWAGGVADSEIRGTCLPRPVQSPHPPLHVACSRSESVVRVGSDGLGVIDLVGGPEDYVSSKVTAYRRAIRQAVGPGRAITSHYACAPLTLVLPDDLEACRYGFRGARFFEDARTGYFLRGAEPGALELSRDFLAEDDLGAARALRNGPEASMRTCVGDPSAAAESISRFADLGVDELLLVMQMGTVPLELVRTSIETFGRQVLPRFS